MQASAKSRLDTIAPSRSLRMAERGRSIAFMICSALGDDSMYAAAFLLGPIEIVRDRWTDGEIG